MSKKLFIIGNGFDLQCGLKSSFMDFFGQVCRPFVIEFASSHSSFISTHKLFDFKNTENKPNFLYLIFDGCFTFHGEKSQIANILFGNNEISSHWFDIEYLLKAIIKNTYNGFTLFDIFKNNYQECLRMKDFDDIVYKNIYKYYFRSYINYEMEEHNNVVNFEDFFLNEIKTFENDFKIFLKDKIDSNFSYAQLKDYLRNGILQIEDGENIFNFNYTSIFTEPSTALNEVNVHGSLNDSDELIIGIDNKDVDCSNEVSIKMSKSYKKLINRKDIIKIINKDITDIYFYGHSLGEQDFSYFLSIFDTVNLYERPVFLHFYYSNNFGNEKEKEQRGKQYALTIFKLLRKYGEGLKNINHGDSLLYKLLLENRIEIVRMEIPDDIKQNLPIYPKRRTRL